MTLHVKARCWIETEKGPFLGRGRIELLEHIEKLGSINKAAAAMNMAYRQAWRLTNSMNAKAKTPLVVKQTGGAGGGGAYLTKEGSEVIRTFRELENSLDEFLQKASEVLNR